MAKVPVVQLKADKKNNKTDDTVVIWEPRTDINTVDAKIVNNKIRIPTTGYYYVYSRVHYEKPKGNGTNNNNEFTIGHTVVKTISGNDKEKRMDNIVQRCFPSNSSGDVRHTNHLGSVQHLHKGDELFVRLDHKQYFDHTNTIFGLFLVAT
ncbi:tumor necrosis factor ligand superfamily member 14-like [Mercenaria mercenaria]|uniref:tumor necrosis factor ligand superfamily member 14-like n=1 Tax=Mercenaria mercenaria TaxID=6596 RepID=UPI00234EE1A4|nr:tumor necrosis factor ligand superfamily member 14-like [Mercenaria mercenaria]